LKRFFTEGNPLVRVGALVTFVGVAFLLRYVGERVSVPMEVRLTGIAAGGLAMIAFGLWVRGRKPGFALPFQGTGIGVLYLTIYAAFRLYSLVPGGVAFGLMLLVVLMTIGLALWQDAMILAAVGVAGGFLAPVLASTGQGSHVELFSYYLGLNVVVAVVAWFRAWRLLNWLGFVFTFGIASAWGAKFYQPEYLSSTEPFLVIHVALYLAVSILFASRQPPNLKGFVDGTLVFGTPIVGFTLQAMLLSDRPTGLAWSSAIFGATYLVLRWQLLSRDREHFQLLGQCFLALGFGFLTLAIPLAFDARVTSAMWTLEGAAVAWVGIRQLSWMRRWSGYALMGLGSLAYLQDNSTAADTLVLLNADYLGVVIIAASFGFIAQLLRRDQAEPRWPLLAPAFWIYACLWWTAGGLTELNNQLAGGKQLLSGMIYLALTALPMALHARQITWRTPQTMAAAIAFLSVPLYAQWYVGQVRSLAANPNLWALGIALITLLGVAHILRQRRFPAAQPLIADGLAAAAGGLWLFGSLVEFEHLLSGATLLTLSTVWVAMSALGWVEYARRVQWRTPQFIAYGHALILLAVQVVWHQPQQPLIFNINVFNGLLSVVAALFVGRWILHRSWPATQRAWANGLAALATGLWLLIGVDEFDSHFAAAPALHLTLMWATLSLLALFTLARPLRWAELRRTAEAHLLLAPLALAAAADAGHVLTQGYGLLAWPLVLAVQYWMLYQRRSDDIGRLTVMHAVSFWTLLGVLTFAIQQRMALLSGADSLWRGACYGAIPALLVVLVRWRAVAGRWPVATALPAYQGIWLAPVMIYLAGWLASINLTAPGSGAYVPLLNGLDAACVLTLVTGALWWNERSLQGQTHRFGVYIIGALAFLTLNAILLRGLHTWLPIAWDLDTLWRSFTVQASVTILWSLTALALMLLASKLRKRWVWMTGAGLIVFALLKLFVVDTAASGTLARIAAFFAVAMVLFVAGYFVPRPPADVDTTEPQEADAET
jgi:uncharacterized membrane protein